MDSLRKILATSKGLNTPHSVPDVLGYLMTEVGELSLEVLIEHSQIASHKEPDKDGIVGEAVDCIICLMDIIRKAEPDITIDELYSLTCRKLEKWAYAESKRK